MWAFEQQWHQQEQFLRQIHHPSQLRPQQKQLFIHVSQYIHKVGRKGRVEIRKIEAEP